VAEDQVGMDQGKKTPNKFGKNGLKNDGRKYRTKCLFRRHTGGVVVNQRALESLSLRRI